MTYEDDEIMNRLLAAIGDDLKERAKAVLTDPRQGGRGLRAMLALFNSGDRPFPTALPAELVAVFLHDSEAEPLYDCEQCGLPVPVRTGWRAGHEPSADRVYFAACPMCGGRTGPYAYWSRAASSNAASIPQASPAAIAG